MGMCTRPAIWDEMFIPVDSEALVRDVREAQRATKRTRSKIQREKNKYLPEEKAKSEEVLSEPV